MSKRLFPDNGRVSAHVEAEDFLNEIVMGGDDPTIVGELVEVWPDADTYYEAARTEAWGDLYAVWGTEAEVEATIEAMGEYIDRKGMTARPEAE